MADDVTTPRTEAEITKAAATQVGAEIAAETAPLSSLIGAYGTNRERAVEDLSSLFGTILPYSERSAQRLEGQYGSALESQRDIFNAAGSRLAQLRGDRAAEAQKLAQEIGSPIPLAEFTAPVAFEEELFPFEAAGSMLHSLSYAQAGSEYAEAFPGKVFPLLQQRETQATKNFYDDKISQLREQIASIQGGKTGRTNARLNDLLTQERQFQLERTRLRQSQEQLNLQKTQSKADLANSKRQLDLSFVQTYGGYIDPKTGKWSPSSKLGVPQTLQEQQMTADQEQAQKLYELKLQEIQLQWTGQLGYKTDDQGNIIYDASGNPTPTAQVALTAKEYNQRLRTAAGEAMLAMTNPSADTQSIFLPLPTGQQNEAAAAAAGAVFYQGLYGKFQNVTTSAGGAGPQEIYDNLVALTGNNAVALTTVRTKFPGFVPGKPYGPQPPKKAKPTFTITVDPAKPGKDWPKGLAPHDYFVYETLSGVEMEKMTPNALVNHLKKMGFNQPQPFGPQVPGDAGQKRLENIKNWARYWIAKLQSIAQTQALSQGVNLTPIKP